MNEYYDTRNSIYCYENTNVLKNRLNIKSKRKLEELERDIVTYRLFELRMRGITGTFDKLHLNAIHKHLFSDIYSFAGKYREENIGKGHFMFANFEYIEESLDIVFDELQKAGYLEGLKKEQFAKELAYYTAEFNVIHPYREGNGRAIREFIRQLSLNAGFILDYRHIDSDEFLQASIKSVTDTKPLEMLYLKILKTKI